MIKLILLTGFLGTGKTTLLRQLIHEFSGEKIGIIINEFGQIGIDGVLIAAKDIPMAELNNGSIFCSCIKENFLKSLIDLSSKDINYLLIEASGLADPANMPQILRTIQTLTLNPYEYQGSICVVDAENFPACYDMLPALHQQVAYSSAVIVNKTDLVDAAALAEVLEKLIDVNPQASLHPTTFCRVDFRKIINSLRTVDFAEQETSNTVESRPKTVTLTSRSALPIEHFKSLMEKLNEYAYRIKGFARTDTGIVYVSGVKGHMEFQLWNGDFDETKIVIVSAVGIQIVSRISRELANSLLKDKIQINIG